SPKPAIALVLTDAPITREVYDDSFAPAKKGVHGLELTLSPSTLEPSGYDLYGLIDLGGLHSYSNDFHVLDSVKISGDWVEGKAHSHNKIGPDVYYSVGFRLKFK